MYVYIHIERVGYFPKFYDILIDSLLFHIAFRRIPVFRISSLRSIHSLFRRNEEGRFSRRLQLCFTGSDAKLNYWRLFSLFVCLPYLSIVCDQYSVACLAEKVPLWRIINFLDIPTSWSWRYRRASCILSSRRAFTSKSCISSRYSSRALPSWNICVRESASLFGISSTIYLFSFFDAVYDCLRISMRIRLSLSLLGRYVPCRCLHLCWCWALLVIGSRGFFAGILLCPHEESFVYLVAITIK